MTAFLDAHKAAYGTSHIKPKHHYGQHSAARAESPDVVQVDCFVHERKHQVLKRAANPVKNSLAFEASVLPRALLEQSRQLDALPPRRGLVGGSTPGAALALALGVSSASVAKALRFDGLQAAVGDIVLADGMAFEVHACVQAQDALFLLARPFELTERRRSSSLWRRKAGLVAVPLGEVPVALPYAWTWPSAGCLHLLHGV
jgi:hypothetical protein